MFLNYFSFLTLGAFILCNSCSRKPNAEEIMILENTRISIKNGQSEISKLEQKIIQLDEDILDNQAVYRSLLDEKEQLKKNLQQVAP